MLHKPFALAALLAASCVAPAAANDDLAAIRSQIDEMKQSYEQRIAALEQKLAKAESSVKTDDPPVPVVENRTISRSTAKARGFNPEVSLILQGQYKNMKEVAERSITGFIPVGGHDHGEGAIESGNKRGFSVDHTELVLAANIDPSWRGQTIIAALDGAAEVEEAWFQSLGLGHGIGLKGGRFRSGIGYLNEQHPHMWDFADAPLAYQVMFGTEGSYTQDGAQFKWVAPTPMFVEFGAEFGRGANFPGTDRNKNGSGGGALFAHLGDDFGISNNWRVGLSYLKTAARERETHFEDGVNEVEALGKFTGNSATWLADFVWKWAPNGNPKYQNFKFQTEYFQRREKGEMTCGEAEAGVAVSCQDISSNYQTRQSGWYAQGVFQFTPNWRAGLRYEQLDSGRRDLGENANYLIIESYRPKKASAMVDYSWSEFSRVRLQFAQDKSMSGVTDNQLSMQYIMSLGAHGAHKF